MIKEEDRSPNKLLAELTQLILNTKPGQLEVKRGSNGNSCIEISPYTFQFAPLVRNNEFGAIIISGINSAHSPHKKETWTFCYDPKHEPGYYWYISEGIQPANVSKLKCNQIANLQNLVKFLQHHQKN